jgi:hypothetical protein
VISTAILRYPTDHTFLFDAATIDWSYGLDDFAQFWPRTSFVALPDLRLQQMTKNLLDAVIHPEMFTADAQAKHA